MTPQANDRSGQRSETNGGLLPSLGLFTSTMMVIGGVIGSGIFRKPGVMASQLGSPSLLIGVWLLAGVITLFGALTNAEIAGLIPETGGQYRYFDKMFGPFAAFLYGWAVFVVMQTGSIAALAYVFAEYAGQLVTLPSLSSPAADWAVHLPFIGDIAPLKDLGTKGLAAAVIILLTAANYVGVRFGGVIQNIFTIAKVGAMAALVLAALVFSSGGGLQNITRASISIHPQGFALLSAIAFALQGAFWGYDGWNKITYIAGEVRDPQRNIPRALFAGMLIVTAIYVIMNLAYAYVLPIDFMAQSKLVAADVAEKCFRGGGKWIAVAVMISTFGTANAVILASARVYFSMAHHNVFPRFIGNVHPQFRTPAASLIVQGIWSVLLLFSGTFDTLTDTLIFVSWVFYAAGAYGVFVLRKKMPETPRPYRVPGYPLVPWIFVLFAAVYLLFTVYNDITGYRAALSQGKPAIINSLFGTVLVLIGTPIYFIYRQRRTPVTKSPP